MNIYDIVMTPIEWLILKDIRTKLMTQAKGDVLEIGVGTGINFKYYDYSIISSLTCLDIEHNADIASKYPNINFVTGSIQELPFEAQTFDCVISTLVLCSVDIERSLLEIQRILKHGGLFIFIEHVKPSGKITSKIAESINHIWQKLANGCNLNRQTDQILKNSGFSKTSMNSHGIFRYGIAEKLRG